MRGLGPVGLVLLALPLMAGGALADEVQSPFSDIPSPSATSPKKKAAATAAAPAIDPGTSGETGRPYLPPMTGGSPGSQPAAGADVTREAVYAKPAPGGGALSDPLKALPPPDERSRGVEREELSPVMAADGSGLPMELWRGLDMKATETLISRLEIPPRSPALHALWHRLITADVAPPSGADQRAFEAVRIEALFRSGLVQEAATRLGKQSNAASDPALAPMFARSEIALGHRDEGCGAAKTVSASRANLPKPMRLEALLMLGYCAAAATNPAAAGLAADLARDEGMGEAPGVHLLDAVANGAKPQLKSEKALSIIDYRLVELTKSPLPEAVLEHAQPAALAVIASDANADAATRLAATEAAVRLNAVSPDALSDAYRAAGGAETAEALLNGQPGAAPASKSDPMHRAHLFKAAESERTPLKKVRLIRAFLDDSRRATLYLPALQMSARAVDGIQPVPEIGWFAETATEVLIAAGNYERARAWARFGGGLDRPGLAAGQGGAGPFGHWLALADIADASLPREQRGRDLGAVEELALRGRFAPEQLHRIATVLDALDYNVPMRLWEAASRTPQPTSGHLPPTGVLSELQDASKKKEFGRTVLLAMDTLGPNGAEGAHMIALGDSIRALRRAGLDADARRLGLEALFATWPRTATN